MLHRHESDASRREDVQGVHERRADDAEGVLHPVGHQRLHEGLARGHGGRRRRGLFSATAHSILT